MKSGGWEDSAMRDYLVIYERGATNWGAYSPDVPGCIATGTSREEVERNFREALIFHLEGLKKDNLPIPEPQSETGRVSVAL